MEQYPQTVILVETGIHTCPSAQVVAWTAACAGVTAGMRGAA